MPDLKPVVARTYGTDGTISGWHRALAHNGGTVFESRCGLRLLPDPGAEGLRVTTEERLYAIMGAGVDREMLCPSCFPATPTEPKARLFRLERDVDETGISGEGHVADGVEFTDGTVVLRWLTAHRSTAVYGAMADVVAIHGHEGRTRVVYDDGEVVP